MDKVLNPSPREGDENTPNSLGSKMLKELSEPWPSGELVKVAMGRAAKLAGLSYWRCHDIWYGKARKVEGYEIEQIAAALQRKNEKDAANDLRDLKFRLAQLESRLSSGDSNFHSPSIDHARDWLRRFGSTGRSLACRGG